MYLLGERNVEELENQICNREGYQGPTRKQCSERFYSSLQVIGKEVECDVNFPVKLDALLEATPIPERVIVKNMRHKHALIYVAKKGQCVLCE